MTKNHLKQTTSPYLLQHKDNPVHWYPWGDEAFKIAKNKDKPILLSIGYAACHWCHVMAHESFEDEETANLMNRYFINIKVDREEYPDVDKIYMDAIQVFGERGGWPLTMFLEPDGTPFWGGTYFPKNPQYGRPGFKQVLTSLSNAWQNDRDKVTHNHNKIISALTNESSSTTSNQIGFDLVIETAEMIVLNTDMKNGGLNGAPKFPQTSMYELLWRAFLETGNGKYQAAVVKTLTQICQGGIYDHLEGGFARYSVDERWLAPHFEKMLYDNALILDLLILVNHTENNDLFRRRIKQSTDWLLSNMVTKEGGFASSYDADSEGKEGTFYVWSYQEVRQVIPKEHVNLFCNIYDISESGNWENTNILNRLNSEKTLDQETRKMLSSCKKMLLLKRKQRPYPGWDDKMLADWNGITISMLCNAAAALKDTNLIKNAETAFTTITKNLLTEGGLFHSSRNGIKTNTATNDDYANLIKAALSLYEVTSKQRFLEQAINLNQLMTKDHWDNKSGGYYFSSARSKNLLVRTKNAHDDATPNANGIMLTNLTKLYHHTGMLEFSQQADKIINAFSFEVAKSPMAYSGFIRGFLDIIKHIHAVIVVAKNNDHPEELIRIIKTAKKPITITIVDTKNHFTLDHPAYGKLAINNQPTVYFCQNKLCSAPINKIEEIQQYIFQL